MNQEYRISVIFFGTSDFAVPSLEKLAQSELFNIKLVITRPDKPKGRKQTLTPPPVKVKANELNLKIIQPKTLRDTRQNKSKTKVHNILRSQNIVNNSIDLFVIVSYGQIIPKEILDIPKYGCINVHPSLLPKYRGPSPIHTALLNGDTKTGITIMLLDEKMDHGKIIKNQKLKIKNNETYTELSQSLSQIGANLLIESITKYLSGEITPREQDHSQATFTKLIRKEDGRVDWNKPAQDIYNQWRAYTPWPGIYTFTENGKRVKILSCKPASSKILHTTAKAGTIHKLHNRKVYVSCGNETSLEVKILQLEGKKINSAHEFLIGCGIKIFT